LIFFYLQNQPQTASPKLIEEKGELASIQLQFDHSLAFERQKDHEGFLPLKEHIAHGFLACFWFFLSCKEK